MYKKLSLLIFSIIVLVMALQAQTDTLQQIRISVPIPRAPAAMVLYKLIATRAPVDFLNEKLEKSKLPTLKLDKQYYIVRSGDNKEEGLHAFIDLKSGDAQFVPNFADVVKNAGNTAQLDSGRATGLAREAFRDQRFIPKDGTELRLGETR